jgi:hypothetical protein
MSRRTLLVAALLGGAALVAVAGAVWRQRATSPPPPTAVAPPPGSADRAEGARRLIEEKLRQDPRRFASCRELLRPPAGTAPTETFEVALLFDDRGRENARSFERQRVVEGRSDLRRVAECVLKEFPRVDVPPGSGSLRVVIPVTP